MKKKKESLMDAAKSHMKIGVVSMAGMGAVGAIGAIPGMPAAASGIIPTVGAGMTLVNVGRLAKTGTQTLPDAMGYKKSKKKYKWM